MKILALIDVAATASLEAVRADLKEELRGAWELFTGDVLREAYTTASPARVVFVLEQPSVETAQATLGKLPMIAKGLCTVQYLELRPFANWSRLFGP